MSKPELTYHAFVCMSLDGFIARKDGSCDFPEEAIEGKQRPEGEDFGTAAFISSVDAIIMGRTTFEQVIGFKDDGKGRQYGDTPIFVPSYSRTKMPKGSPENATLIKPPTVIQVDQRVNFMIDAVEKHFTTEKDSSEKKVYVDGATLIAQFIDVKLLNEITITVIPIIIGEGIRLFGTMRHDVKLDLVKNKGWQVGYAQMRYKLRYHPDY